MTDDVAAIVGKLTEAQRQAIILCDGVKPAYALRDDHEGRLAVWDIRKTGMFEKVCVRGSQHWHYRLNAIGLLVRQHLKGSGDDAHAFIEGKAK